MGKSNSNSKERWVAIVTGVFSIAIAIIYLILITVLDARGPMLPPPSEALGVVEVAFSDSFEVVLQPYELPISRNFVEMIHDGLGHSDVVQLLAPLHPPSLDLV